MLVGCFHELSSTWYVSAYVARYLLEISHMSPFAAMRFEAP